MLRVWGWNKLGSLGSSIRAQIRNLLSDANIKSELTLTPISRTTGASSGYEQPTEAEGTDVTVDCVPSNYIKTRIGLEKMGDLQEGEIRVLIRDDQTIDTNDKVTFKSQSYLIREEKNIFFNEVIIAKSLILSKVQ